ncbi:SCAN box domain-containing protein [Trichonephila clavipes]|nr:SCAN box domain-containing protein [Trichonephila clavipes]
MFLAGHPSQACFGLQSHCAPCYFFNQASFYPSDFSFMYSGARPKETPKDFKSKIQIKKEPVHEKNHKKDFEKRRQLRCYECGSYSHLRPQCDKLKKNYETVTSNETVRNGTDVLAPYTSLGTVNGIEMPILRDTDQGKYLLGNKTAALFEEVKKNKEIQMYMVNAVETRSQKKLIEESKQDLNMSEETVPESNEKNKESPDELDDILPLIQPEISVNKIF